MPNPPVICTFNTTSKLIDIVQSIAVITSPPALGAGAPIVLNASGQLDLSLIATPIPVPGGTTPQLQYDNAGVFAGLGGSAADGVNGLLTLTGIGTGVVLRLFGDVNGSDIQGWYLNGATLVANINQYGSLTIAPTPTISANPALVVVGDGTNDIAQFQITAGSPAVTINTGGGMMIAGDFSFGGHLNTEQYTSPPAANTDLAGTITITASTTEPYTFTNPFVGTDPPVVVLTPTSDPTTTGTYWITYQGGAGNWTGFTANVSLVGTITFNYMVMGNPN